MFEGEMKQAKENVKRQIDVQKEYLKLKEKGIELKQKLVRENMAFQHKHIMEEIKALKKAKIKTFNRRDSYNGKSKKE